jgi:DNA-binding response OmpR family regulator
MTKVRLLIIDDQPEVRAEVKERIASLGHDADEAACQEEALRKIEGMQYDCVLLDLKIPIKLEGVPRIEHGKNLLQRIVAMAGAPPVIVITSYGLEGHQLAVEMMEIGAKSFVAKPFDGGPLEQKIQQILGNSKNKPPKKTSSLKPFEGGALVMNDNGIELCGVVVGGVRANSIIRSVVQRLSMKKNGEYRKESAQSLASSITSSLNAQTVTAAIKDFRNQCTEKLRQSGIECPDDAVIKTARAGGYHFRDWIEVRLGKDSNLSDEVEQDCAQVMRIFGREKKRTVKQVVDSVSLSPVRVKAAIQILEQRGKIKNIGGSGVTTTYECISA